MFTLQDLSPEAAHLCLDVEKFIRRELDLEVQGKTILIAFSGGVDSTGLALFCRIMQDRWQSRVFAAHLDHNLREDSGPQAKAARQTCTSLAIPCILGSTRVRTYAARIGLGIEEAGRRLRYRFLRGVLRKTGADLLLTGHHLNDLAEDSILRQLRGTGWPALAGMEAWNPESTLLRPFLLTPKARLVCFVRELGLSWQEDRSNLDPDYKRNRIRQNILPGLLAENPNYLQSVAQLWRQARLDDTFWTVKLHELGRFERTGPSRISIDRAGLEENLPALRLRWYRDIVQRLGPGQPRADALFNLDRAWTRKSWGKVVEFPGGKRAEVRPEGIRFSSECKNPNPDS
ncbi:MAG: tRNA lysidine(34) synthetase TilS [Desulfohalobiaceae bacterium]|nr:tRNA lysidine(34) synthetase TilS [Desulfohalobiaceae bacterium]